MTAAAPATPPRTAIDALVVGDGELAGALVEELRERGARTTHLRRPNDRALAAELAHRPGFVAVISHDDIAALRLALVAEHAYPGVSLLVTIFDATVAAQLVRHVPNCRVVSLADAAAPVLAADCMRAARTVSRGAARWELATSQLRPYDASSRLLLGGVLGLALILVAETVVGWAGFGHPLATAFYESAKATATVGPDSVAEESGRAYAVVVGAAMLLATALTAAATAGLINRLTTRRLVALVGRRTLPRRDHVLVIGLGQVGLRLAMMLQHQGVRVVAIERDRHAPNVHLAKRLDIPVMIGDGTERGLLIRLGVRRAAALASVTSDDHVNIAVSVAALAVRDDLRVVLRAGDDDAVTETRALFPIGVVRDVNRLAAGHFAELAVAGAGAAA